MPAPQWLHDPSALGEEHRQHLPETDEGRQNLLSLQRKRRIVAQDMDGRLENTEDSLDRKTIGRVYKRLEQVGFISFPEGPRKGATITKG